MKRLSNVLQVHITLCSVWATDLSAVFALQVPTTRFTARLVASLAVNSPHQLKDLPLVSATVCIEVTQLLMLLAAASVVTTSSLRKVSLKDQFLPTMIVLP